MGFETMVVSALVGAAAVWMGRRAWRALRPPSGIQHGGACTGCTGCPSSPGGGSDCDSFGNVQRTRRHE